MTEFLSEKLKRNTPAKAGIGVLSSSAEYVTNSDEAIDNGDFAHLFSLQKDTKLIDLVLNSEDIDSGAGAVMDVVLKGELNSITIVSSSDIGQAGGIARAGQNIPYTLPEDMRLSVKFSTKPATQVNDKKIEVTAIHTNDL